MTAPHPLRCDHHLMCGITVHEDCADTKCKFYEHSSTTTAEAKVLKQFLGKAAIRIRQEFCQDDTGEWYLSAEDFENVLDELNQEIEDEIELRQQERERG